MFNNIAETVLAFSFDLESDLHEKIYIIVKQVVNPNSTLCYFRNIRWRKMTTKLLNYKLTYLQGMITL